MISRIVFVGQSVLITASETANGPLVTFIYICTNIDLLIYWFLGAEKKKVTSGGASNLSKSLKIAKRIIYMNKTLSVYI